MATDEERREVAARLREEADTFHALNPFKAIKVCIWPDGGNHSDVEWIRRLADLIDPDTTNNRLEDRLISPIASPTVDRDALLSIASTLLEASDRDCEGCMLRDGCPGKVCAIRLSNKVAEKIYEALGAAE